MVCLPAYNYHPICSKCSHGCTVVLDMKRPNVWQGWVRVWAAAGSLQRDSDGRLLEADGASKISGVVLWHCIWLPCGDCT